MPPYTFPSASCADPPECTAEATEEPTVPQPDTARSSASPTPRTMAKKRNKKLLAACLRAVAFVVSLAMFIVICVLWGEIPIVDCTTIFFDPNLRAFGLDPNATLTANLPQLESRVVGPVKNSGPSGVTFEGFSVVDVLPVGKKAALLDCPAPDKKTKISASLKGLLSVSVSGEVLYQSNCMLNNTRGQFIGNIRMRLEVSSSNFKRTIFRQSVSTPTWTGTTENPSVLVVLGLHIFDEQQYFFRAWRLKGDGEVLTAVLTFSAAPRPLPVLALSLLISLAVVYL
eukprot:NODE_349_length_1865_cov_82.193833_g292_i0.p1 GENE.NODE_349_length_1865_cov_82.193833_g292_i0~~NODE_349_length_1865_cov_82.193833_g292_i0.p1  ORF type:complete len:285 (+),score=65.64 NODE_349_length_1865_cov_82.193833_g292_i0:786-1640(+)